MSNIRIVSHAAFGKSRWLKPQGYRFAAKDTFVPLTLRELGSAIHAMPVCLLKNANGFQLGGLMGLEGGENLFVAPDGTWLGAYVPVAYAHYPFLMARTGEGTEVLGVWDDESVVAEGIQGERIFDDEGKPSPAIQEIFSKLGEHTRHLKVTQLATTALVEKDLIEPWPLRIQSDDKTRMISELYRINEARLRELPAQNLAELRDCGALLLAYAQLLSMSQVQVLGTLARIRGELREKYVNLPQVDTNNHGILSFDNL